MVFLAFFALFLTFCSANAWAPPSQFQALEDKLERVLMTMQTLQTKVEAMQDMQTEVARLDMGLKMVQADMKKIQSSAS